LPLYVSDVINGFPVIQIDSAHIGFSLPSGFNDFTAGITYFAIAKGDPTAGGLMYTIDLRLSPSTVNDAIQFTQGSADGPGVASADGMSVANATSAGFVRAPGRNDFHLMTATHNGSNIGTLFINGDQVAQTSTLVPTRVINRTWNRLAGGVLGSYAQIAEMLVYNRNLSFAERRVVEAYLMARYGLSIPNTPTFNLASGTLNEPTQVALTSDEAAQLFYTTDGTTPSSASALYTKPLQLNYTQTIKAIAIKDGRSSSVVSATYTLDAARYPAPSGSDTNAPKIYVQVPTPAQ
jgi:hypothetical protein